MLRATSPYHAGWGDRGLAAGCGVAGGGPVVDGVDCGVGVSGLAGPAATHRSPAHEA